MAELNEKDIIYDWNQFARTKPPEHPFILDDETLRDGLQSPSITDPPLEDKLRILHLMEDLGIGAADIGLPGAGPHIVAAVTAIAQEIVRSKMKIKPNCAARTVITDIEPIVGISQKVGIQLEVMAFIGSSPIRIYTEDWDEAVMLKRVRESVEFCIKNNLKVCFVTEDTVRARPEMVKSLYGTALEAGAQRLCLCDTVGHATPDGAYALVKFLQKEVIEAGGYKNIGIDWHGHNDRGHAIPNALSALEAGADRIHGTAMGIGERCGNTAMDQLITNLYLLGWFRHDVSKMVEYCELVSRACGHPIPPNYPVVGRDAFRTGTGVHAAAVIKAEKKGDKWLADRVYSGVPAGAFGREQEIEVGPVSGESNVIYWLRKRNIEPKGNLVKTVLSRAKDSKRILTDEEILSLVRAGEA